MEGVATDSLNELRAYCKPDHACDLCVTLPSYWYCHGCKRLLCSICRKSHVQQSACVEEDIQTVDKVATECKAALQSERNAALGLLQSINASSSDLTCYYEEMRVEVLRHLEAEQNETIQRIVDHFQKQKHLVNGTIDAELKDSRTPFETSRASIDKLTEPYDIILGSSNVGVVSGYEKAVDLASRQQRVALRAVRQFTDSPRIEISVGNANKSVTAWDENKAVWVEFTRPASVSDGTSKTAESAQRSPGFSSGRSSSRDESQMSKFLIRKKLSLDEKPVAVRIIQDQIWILFLNRIEIRSEQGFKLVAIIQDGVKDATGMTTDGNDEFVFISSSTSGITFLDKTTRKPSRISSGRYGSILHHEDDLIGLCVKKGNSFWEGAVIWLHFYREADGIWKLFKEIPTEINCGQGTFTLGVWEGVIFICNNQENVVYEVRLKDEITSEKQTASNGHREGVLCDTFGKFDKHYPGMIHRPVILSSRLKTEIIVADCANNRLWQIASESVSQRKAKWEALGFQDMVYGPVTGWLESWHKLVLVTNQPQKHAGFQMLVFHR